MGPPCIILALRRLLAPSTSYIVDRTATLDAFGKTMANHARRPSAIDELETQVLTADTVSVDA